MISSLYQTVKVLSRDYFFVWTSFQDISHRIVFSLREPEVVFIFDGDLASNILTTEGFVAWEPSGSVTIGFLLVGLAVGGDEI